MDTQTLQKLYADKIAAEHAYRMARATHYLELAVPKDGSKKPSDAIIDAMLDTDMDLETLRLAKDNAAAALKVGEYIADHEGVTP